MPAKRILYAYTKPNGLDYPVVPLKYDDVGSRERDGR